MSSPLENKEIKNLFESTKDILKNLGVNERAEELERRINSAETEKEVIDIIKEYVEFTNPEKPGIWT